jgi:DNA (cytosine-5)-methyltransferase 1
MSGFTFGSLFAGIGGIDLGFERCGMQCKWQVEINDYAQKVLAKHWPKVHRERDIRECSASNLERVDIIAGGFPCQDISYAGLGAGLDGERSGLFFEAVRLVRELQPRAVVLENVAALLTRGLDRVLGTLAEVGYDAEWHCIPAAYVGAPHIRDRVFVLAYAQSVGNSKREQSPRRANEAGPCRAERINLDGRCCRAKDVADANCERRPWSRIPEIGTKEVYDASGCCWWNESSSRGLGTRKVEDVAYTNIKDAQGQRQEPIGIKPQFRDVSYESWWAVEPDICRVANGIPARVDRLRGLGNAVVPQVAELVGRMVIERLNRN